MKGEGKFLSNSYSTGGGGTHFENRVQASFVVLMLTGGYSPCLPTWPIYEIKLQGKYLGADTDDLIVYVKQPNQETKAKLLGQIKHSIKITSSDKVFGEVIQAAWNDFNNKKIFNQERDVIALITGPLSAIDTIHVRSLLEQAHYSKDEKDFIERISLGKFTSNDQRKKLGVFKEQLRVANNGNDLTDYQLWRFLKSFHLIQYDLDIKGVTLSLLHSLIGQFTRDRSEDILALIEKDITYRSENAGTITFETIPENILSVFSNPIKRIIPTEFIESEISAITNWNNHEQASKLVIASLLGAWSENKHDDKEIVTSMARVDYLDWIGGLKEILQKSDSPIKIKNGIWFIEDRNLLWETLGSRIFDDMIDRFRECAITVLSERDPKFDLEPDQRFASSIYGKKLSYSETLRKNIAETLALFSNNAEYLKNCSLNKPAVTSSIIVHEILKNADWVVWGSLNNILPILAEAAPEEFLNAVERSLNQEDSPFVQLFKQEGDGISGSNYLTGLLWGLESLAWDEKYLVRVTVILGELSSRDPGGNWANRPENSLVSIYLPWFPQTTASINKRKVAVKTLVNEMPEVAWRLLLNLLPNQRQNSSGTFKPVWRKALLEEWNENINRDEYWEQVTIYSEMVTEIAKDDYNKITELINYLNHLPILSFNKVLEYSVTSKIINKSESERLALWTELVKFALKHRKFADAKWALDNELIKKVEKSAEKLAPKNPFNLYQILFNERDSDLFEEKGDWKQQQELLDKRRRQAIREIYDSGGIDEVIRFSFSVDSPILVGYALGTIDDLEVDGEIFPDLIDIENANISNFVSAYVSGRHSSKGYKWLGKININSWTVAQVGQFLRWLPFNSETWEIASELLGDEVHEYWRRTNVNPYRSSDEELEIAANKLLSYGRPNMAVYCLQAINNKQKIDKSLIVNALLNALSTMDTEPLRNSYYYTELIKVLQDDPITLLDDLLEVEWAYLPLLVREEGISPKLLEEKLASDPTFFMDMIKIVYRSNKVEKVKELTVEQKERAKYVYDLLAGWKTPPGLKKNATFSREEFRNWLNVVKISSRESGHYEVALNNIGKVLFYSPPDPDGLWINRTVAEALNSKEAEKMRSGFNTNIFNSRGSHWVDPTGHEERKLATKYRKLANEVEDAGFHRFASALNSIADLYDNEANTIIKEHEN
ncbi:hypothetical protein NDK25_04965 [Niallia taxi]|nr:hypothetical protein [Niallia taxi]MDE5051764.1 hypothetical protein [Niallia taxi]